MTWSDDHKSQFDSEWLAARAFTKENWTSRGKFIRGSDPVLWDSKFDLAKTTFKFEDIVDSNDALLNWLNGICVLSNLFCSHTFIKFFVAIQNNIHCIDLEVFGMTIVTNVGPGKLKDLYGCIGVPKLNHYGQEFTVEAKVDPNNLAYTTNTLGLHLDLPYYENNPGVRKIHF